MSAQRTLVEDLAGAEADYDSRGSCAFAQDLAWRLAKEGSLSDDDLRQSAQRVADAIARQFQADYAHALDIAKVGDYILHFTAAKYARGCWPVMLVAAAQRADALTETSDYGLGWDLVDVIRHTLALLGQPLLDEYTRVIAFNLVSAISNPLHDRSLDELRANQELIMRELPPLDGAATLQRVDAPTSAGWRCRQQHRPTPTRPCASWR